MENIIKQEEMEIPTVKAEENPLQNEHTNLQNNLHNNLQMFPFQNMVPNMNYIQNPTNFQKNQVNYSKEFWNMYLKNETISQKITDCIGDIKTIKKRIINLEIDIKNFEYKIRNKRKKKNRRKAVQIEKTYKCPYENCGKDYGSDVSMNFHIRLKHQGGNKTERFQTARAIIFAKLTRQPLPKTDLIIPQQFLEEIEKQMLKEIENKGKKEGSDEQNEGKTEEMAEMAEMTYDKSNIENSLKRD